MITGDRGDHVVFRSLWFSFTVARDCKMLNLGGFWCNAFVGRTVHWEILREE